MIELAAQAAVNDLFADLDNGTAEDRRVNPLEKLHTLAGDAGQLGCETLERGIIERNRGGDFAADILTRAREEAELFRKEAATNLTAALARRERMALDKITQAEAQAVAEVRSQAVDLAVAAAQRILEQQMAGPKAGSLIDQSIAELDRKLH